MAVCAVTLAQFSCIFPCLLGKIQGKNRYFGWLDNKRMPNALFSRALSALFPINKNREKYNGRYSFSHSGERLLAACQMAFVTKNEDGITRYQ